MRGVNQVFAMPDKHLSRAFDASLDALSTHLLEMGGLVEMQIERCRRLLNAYDPALALQIRESVCSTHSHEWTRLTPRGSCGTTKPLTNCSARFPEGSPCR